MLIQDLNHVEIISEETNLEGGGIVFASTGALAAGSKLASTNSFAQGSTNSSFGYYYYGGDYAQGSGNSSAFALGRNSFAQSFVDVVAIA